MRLFKLLLFSAIATGCGACGTDPVNSPTPIIIPRVLPRVLTIGDSITHGWALALSYMLKDEYNVTRVLIGPKNDDWIENCRNTTFTLKNLDTWLKWYPDPKIITWNNGVWDASAGGPEEPFKYNTGVVLYEQNLIAIATKLKATKARVIFVTTTQLNPLEGRGAMGLNIQFNEIAKRVLPPLGIEIVDLWDFTIDHHEWHINDGDVHFNGIGNEILADFFLPIIRKGF